MFRTSISILFISLLLLTQYGRQLAYLQCKIENFTTKTNTATCDCEKNNEQNLNKDDAKLPSQKTHVHISLDEYYLMNDQASFSQINTIQKDFMIFSSSFLPAHSYGIFHPPQL